MTELLVWVFLIACVAGGFWIAYEQNQDANRNAHKIVCPHCQTSGHIKVFVVQRKKGISGGKATGAVMTGGMSMFATGLSRKQTVRHMKCGNCGVEWDVE